MDTSSIFLERWPDRFESFAVWQKTMADRSLNTLSFEDVRILTSIEIERERERERRGRRAQDSFLVDGESTRKKRNPSGSQESRDAGILYNSISQPLVR